MVTEERSGPDKSVRVTIRDVAQRVGVSSAAVSYAMSGRPGVSEDLRDRVLTAAEDLGTAPTR
ncbi:LacI family DNA-binding transcriptional regulator [Arthrobacter humicola]